MAEDIVEDERDAFGRGHRLEHDQEGQADRLVQGDPVGRVDGGAARAIWIVGAQKVVPDLDTALRRVEDHCLPLESARTREAYGWPSAINRLLVLNAEHQPGRGTVLLLREAIGF